MAVIDVNPLLGETTCESLLQHLQRIWDEVGESNEDRDKMLLQIEQGCLDVYKRKVDLAVKSRDQLLQTLADANFELSTLLSALGEKHDVGIPEKTFGTIKEQLADIEPTLEKLCKQKEQRLKEFSDVQTQIQEICGEIVGKLNLNEAPVVDESDLSLKKLEEYHGLLQELQKKKSERLHKVLEFVSTVHDLCSVLGMDFYSTVTEVHPSLNGSTGVQSKSISNETLSKLSQTVVALKEDKKQRLQKLQELANQLIDLWNLMDTPDDERRLFDHVTCNISAAVGEVIIPGALALDLIEEAEVEVERLDQLKFSRMKEIAFKKQGELEEIYARTHIEIDTKAAREKILAIIDAGNVEPSELISDMDSQILKAKEEALSRKEILDRVKKWMSACEEENWLEDYNRDDNRYNASGGAHLNLRAERARILVNNIPAMVDTLVAKTLAWEEEGGLAFTYDGVPLLALLDEYAMLRHDREEKRRLRSWIEERLREIQLLLNNTVQVLAGKTHIDGIVRQTSDGLHGQYWDLWNRQKLSSEHEQKRNDLLNGNQNWVNFEAPKTTVKRMMVQNERPKFGGLFSSRDKQPASPVKLEGSLATDSKVVPVQYRNDRKDMSQKLDSSSHGTSNLKWAGGNTELLKAGPEQIPRWRLSQGDNLTSANISSSSSFSLSKIADPNTKKDNSLSTPERPGTQIENVNRFGSSCTTSSVTKPSSVSLFCRPGTDFSRSSLDSVEEPIKIAPQAESDRVNAENNTASTPQSPKKLALSSSSGLNFAQSTPSSPPAEVPKAVVSSSDLKKSDTPVPEVSITPQKQSPADISTPASPLELGGPIVEKNNIDSTVVGEDEIDEEAPETNQIVNQSLGSFGGFGLGSTPSSTAPKSNPFGVPIASTPQTVASSVSFSVPSGELFRPASFSFPSMQPPQVSQPSSFGAPSGAFGFTNPQQASPGSGFGQPSQIGSQQSSPGGGFGQPSQIGSGQQALGSVLGSFGQSRQIGAGLPGSGFGVPQSVGGFAAISSTSGGFGGGFANAATSGGGFGAAATVGGFAAAAAPGAGGFASVAPSGGGFAAAASSGGGGFGAFSKPGGGGFSGWWC